MPLVHWNRTLPFLVVRLGSVEEIFDLADVPEIWANSKTPEDFDGHFLCLVRRRPILPLQFQVQRLKEFWVRIVLEMEGILNSEASCEPRVHILDRGSVKVQPEFSFLTWNISSICSL